MVRKIIPMKNWNFGNRMIQKFEEIYINNDCKTVMF